MNIDYIPNREEELIITPFDSKGQHLVTIEKYNKRILINEAILNLLNLIDGKKSIKTIITDYNTKYKSDMTFDDFVSLHDDKLADTGIIKSEREIDSTNRTSYLALRYQFLSSNSVGVVASKILPLFESKVFVSIFSIALFIYISIFWNFFEAGSFYEKLSVTDLLIIKIFMFITIFSHEFGHAGACIRHGAKSDGIGFGFYILAPVFYADVSDAWKLPVKQRVIVNLGGIYIQSIIGAFVAIAYYYTQENYLMGILLFNLISMVTSLNPLLRYDGYWILSDVTNTPNLRKRSTIVLKDFIVDKLFLNPSLIKGKDWFLLIYALISYGFLIIFVGLILTNDPYSILFFPKNVYDYLASIGLGIFSFTAIKDFLREFMIPIIFYFFLIKMALAQKKSIKKIFQF